MCIRDRFHASQILPVEELVVLEDELHAPALGIDLTGKDWTPIGTSFDNSYTGTFDGGGDVYKRQIKSRLDLWNVLGKMLPASYTDNATPLYWMDFGNTQTTGQVIMGTVLKKIRQPASTLYEACLLYTSGRGHQGV